MQEPWTFEAIGTHWEICFPEALTDEETHSLRERVSSRIEAYDLAYSRFRSDSLVTRMAHAPGTYTLPDDAPPLMHLYLDLYDRTEGAVTPLIGQVLSDAGYDAEYSFTEQELAAPKSLTEVLSYTHPELTLSEPALLDFGAAGKGYLVDIVADMIESESGGDYLVNAGGDIRVRSDQPVRVGLEHPGDESLAIGVAQLTEGSICGSAGNRRAWGGYHHIMDPHTLKSVEGIRAIWVVAREARIADALTTALFFVQPYILEREYDFEYLIVRDDYSLVVSDAFPAEIFT